MIMKSRMKRRVPSVSVPTGVRGEEQSHKYHKYRRILTPCTSYHHNGHPGRAPHVLAKGSFDRVIIFSAGGGGMGRP